MASGPFGLHGDRAAGSGRSERERGYGQPSSPGGADEEEGILSWFGLTYVTELIMGGKMCGGFRDKAPIADAQEAAKYGRPPEPAGRSMFPAARGDEDRREERRGRQLDEDDAAPTTAERSMYGRRGAGNQAQLSNVLQDHLSSRDDGGSAPSRGRQPAAYERAKLEDMDQTMPGRYGDGPLPSDFGGSSRFGGADALSRQGDPRLEPPSRGRDPGRDMRFNAGRDDLASSSRAQDIALGSGGSVNSMMEEFRMRNNKPQAAAASVAASFGDSSARSGPGAQPAAPASAGAKLNTSFNSVPAFKGPTGSAKDEPDVLEATQRMPPSRLDKPKEEPRPPVSSPAPPPRSDSKAWEWPEWAMDSSSACIEVFVEDEDTGDSRWVPATPQTRVVNKQGHDAFLTVQYEWDGEIYDQDFEPHHVRRRGATKTIKDMIDSGTINEPLRVVGKPTPTPPAPPPRAQPGAGVDLDSTAIADRSMLDKTLLSKPPAENTANAQKAASMPDGGAAAKPGNSTSGPWRWPPWCLNSKSPAIEVFVEDEETGEGRWLEATPMNRVVDKDGNDAFISAEYDWDGEDYVQDFAPEHVRKRGSKATVQDLIKSGNLS
mmetsp:Transcript_66901/g.160180  ORF Transcript_66901/g.160180 Transcript_66901/m.160180 type:complete len:603 (+) Transcript_66901:174-1982(+)